MANVVNNNKDILLDIQQLNVAFQAIQGQRHAVRDLNLSLYRGETLALVGESGCGKSTTALSLLRLLAPSAMIDGHIYFNGQDILGLSDAALRDVRGRQISMIFQEPMTSLNPVFTIGDQIAETIRHHENVSALAARRRSIELLDLVCIPEPHQRFDDYPHHLSGGQRQRVMIAMAVACHPTLLIADEPTTALDVTIQAQILQLLDTLRRDLSMAILLITHDLGVVSQWADRVAVMYDGRKVEEASTRHLFDAPQHPYTQGLLGASLHTGHDVHYSQRRLPELIVHNEALSTSARFELTTPAAIVPTAPKGHSTDHGQLRPILSVQNLHTHYTSTSGVVKAVNGVTFEIAAGETLGLVGESGCGKSTLSRTLMRLVPATSGKILLEDTDITTMGERMLTPWRKKIQMVFQDPYASLNPRRKVFDILDSVLIVHGVSDKATRRRDILAMLDSVGLTGDAQHRYPHEFSGGQRQRIGIARALILKPSLVILDEPVSALDVSIQAQILNLLVELKEKFNLSYLFISHDLSVIRYLSDRVLVMHQGEVVESGDVGQVWHAPQHAYTRQLIASVPRGHQSVGEISNLLSA